jgi:hypothetical protein
MKDKKPTSKKEKAEEKPRFDKNHKLIIPKKPEQKEEIIVLSFEDLFDCIEDMKLQKIAFKDVHGGHRLKDNLSPLGDFRPSKYGLRFYPWRDGLTHPIRLTSKEDLERAKKIMIAIKDGRIIKDKKIAGYKHGDFKTESKKDFVEHIIREIQ